jgi:hypothetical protein
VAVAARDPSRHSHEAIMALVAGVVAEQLDARDAAVVQRRPVVDRADFAGASADRRLTASIRGRSQSAYGEGRARMGIRLENDSLWQVDPIDTVTSVHYRCPQVKMLGSDRAE